MIRLAYIAVVLQLGVAVAHGAAAERDAVPADCWAARKHGHAAEAQQCFNALTRSVDAYARAEGFWGLEDWQKANEQFRLATQPADSKPLYRVRWGTLLHERFNNKEAADLFQEALAKDPSSAQAYLGLAVLSADGFDSRANEYATKSAELDPRLADTHELLAKLALENDNRPSALDEADKAIAMENDAMGAMAVHAAIELIEDRPLDAWLAKIASINPAYGPAYADIAHYLELHYRFEDSVVWYRKATAADARLWSAHSLLGIALMREGKEDEPLRELELSYNNGYRDPATVNSLRLLDSYKNFETVTDSTTIVKLGKGEADLLRPYIHAEMLTILVTYEKKYGIRLPLPVQVEVYPNHEDFAVRTLGMPGLGALGVTFGEVVAMDSPSGRKPGDFNWGATLWHEMSHVFIITATHQRVPRWFTEGMAVHEEGERSAEWSGRVTPDVLIAIRDKKLLPILRLDRGFVFPEYPQQVLVSYFQAGTLCDFVKVKWGEAKLMQMVHSYAASKSTAEVVQGDLGVAPEEFDRQYLAWIEGKYGAEAAGFDAWRAVLKTLAAAAKATQLDEVLRQGPAVQAMYPEYVGDANAYELVADAARAKGDATVETKSLLTYEHEGGEQPEVLKRLATLQQAAGNNAEAAATLARVNYIYPVQDEALHRTLGGLLMTQKDYAGAVREYTAAIACAPLDKAGANLSLAQAYLAAGQRDKAEEYVLAALETAPGYRPAQKLLLQLQRALPTPN